MTPCERLGPNFPWTNYTKIIGFFLLHVGKIFNYFYPFYTHKVHPMYDTVLTQSISQVCYVFKKDLFKNKYLHGKMDRALDYESRTQEFGSPRAHYPRQNLALIQSLNYIT